MKNDDTLTLSRDARRLARRLERASSRPKREAILYDALRKYAHSGWFRALVFHVDIDAQGITEYIDGAESRWPKRPRAKRKFIAGCADCRREARTR